MVIVLLVKFTNLFNWVRFKTSTPMESFRNRLLIERDSKQRRVMSNFGLTFRNSKWVGYSQNNLNTRQNSTLKVGTPLTITGFLLLLIVLCTQVTYFNGLFEYTFIGGLLDTLVESVVTSLEHFAVVSFITSLSLINFFFTTMFTTMFTAKVEPRNTLINNDLNTFNQVSSKNTSQLLFTAKLKNLNSSVSSFTISNIFTNQLHNQIPVNLSLTTQQLYKSVEGCANMGTKQTFGKTSLITTNSSSYEHLLTNKWSLSNLNNESSSREISTGVGLYSMNNHSFRQLTKLSTTQPELKTLSTLHNNYISTARVDRWLYRYSMLHRKSLHKAHNLTLVKRLTSLGFFNASLTSNNLWASSFIQQTSNLQNTLSNLYVSLYGNIWHNSTNTLSSSGTTTNPLTSLEFFETSYFWVLKRFYLTNTLNNHHTNSNLRLKTSPTPVNSVSATNTNNNQSVVLHLNLEDKAIFVTTPYTKQDSTTTEPLTQQPVLSRDIVSTYLENEVLRGDNLTTMFWVYDDKLSNNFSYNFFNYNSYPTGTVRVLNTTSLTPHQPHTSSEEFTKASTLQTYLDFTQVV